MEKEKTDNNVSYFAFDGAMAMMERTNHRQFIVIIVLILALIATNTAWILYENQFETYDETYQEVSQSTKGGNNEFIGGDYYGTTDGQDN